MHVATADGGQADRLQYLFDRQEILDCLTRCCRGADRSDRDLYLSTFHPDAVADVGPFVGAPDSLYDWAEKLRHASPSVHHHILNHGCEIVGDIAHAETYYIFVAPNDDGTNLTAGGRYIDRFERRDGVWKIAMRQNLLEWSGLMPAAALPLVEAPDIHLNGRPSRSRNDPSYRRPLVNMRPISMPPGSATADAADEVEAS